MNDTERREKCAELRKILETMEVPSFRCQDLRNSNLLWLQRNLHINNGAHPQLGNALSLIGKILRADRGGKKDS